MEEEQPKFEPEIVEDLTPGRVIIFSQRLVENLKERRKAESGANPGPHLNSTASTPDTEAT
jgi:hypothetical protein